jgi:hypothetical protein
MHELNLSAYREASQKLGAAKCMTAKEVTSWMGAIQAQDYGMSKWAIGVRLQNSTIASVDAEIDSGKIVRTHLLRPTWHFVSSDDIYWILKLTAPKIKALSVGREKQLEITNDVFSKCSRIIERSLRDNNHLTRSELIEELKKSSINVEENRASHIFMRAELDGIICSGKQKNGKQTYAILEEWIPHGRKLAKDEALKELAFRYFSSHGPATINDFTWWSGLTLTDARLAVKLNEGQLRAEATNDRTYWMADRLNHSGVNTGNLIMLPAYDEFLIAYKDRSASLSHLDNWKVISGNGIFYPLILHEGNVIGTWRRILKKDKVIICKKIFVQGTPAIEKMTEISSAKYSEFIGKELIFMLDCENL